MKLLVESRAGGGGRHQAVHHRVQVFRPDGRAVDHEGRQGGRQVEVGGLVGLQGLDPQPRLELGQHDQLGPVPEARAHGHVHGVDVVEREDAQQDVLVQARRLFDDLDQGFQLELFRKGYFWPPKSPQCRQILAPNGLF